MMQILWSVRFAVICIAGGGCGILLTPCESVAISNRPVASFRSGVALLVLSYITEIPAGE